MSCSCLWDGAPENGHGSLVSGPARCLPGQRRWSARGEVQPTGGTKPLGGEMGIRRLGRDCWGDWRKAGTLGGQPSLWRMDWSPSAAEGGSVSLPVTEGRCFLHLLMCMYGEATDEEEQELT